MVKVTRTIEIEEIGPVTIQVNHTGNVEVCGESFVLELLREEAIKLSELIRDAGFEAECA